LPARNPQQNIRLAARQANSLECVDGGGLVRKRASVPAESTPSVASLQRRAVSFPQTLISHLVSAQ